MSLQEVDAGPTSAPPLSTSAAPVARWARLRALGRDLGALVAAETVVAALAVLWLVARTEAGRMDIGDGDAAIAMALVGGVVPAWLAWLALHSLQGATPGQRHAGLLVAAQRPRDHLLRLALDPRGLVGWLWLAALLWLGEARLLRWLALFALAGVVAIVAASAWLWLFGPHARALHDRLSRTTLVAR